MVWNLFGFEENPAPAEEPTQPIATPEDAAKTVEEALECDYERDCTPLYKQIESEEWNSVAKFLDTGYWPGNFFADSIVPADQARTWVTRFDPNDNKKVRWSQLPLHLAIVIEAPYEIVGRLIELYPQAVRCTDDQHMLPLHLAMRHGSSDRIVDLLLAAFPDAVNAKGKNDRTPIDCAIRGPNKIRGRILGAFVEKSKTKATKAAVAAYTKEIALLKAKLEDKSSQLDEIRSKVAALETAKESVELDLKAKIEELEQAKLNIEMEANKKFEEYQTERLVEELEIQKKIEELEKEKVELEKAHEQAREEEVTLRRDLENFQMQVVESTSPDDLQKLKKEVENLKNFRLEASRTQAGEEMEAMKKQLADQILKTDDTTREELHKMQLAIDGLRQQSVVATSNDEIGALKAELVALRKELKEKEEANKTKIDLVLMKKSLEKEMAESENKTQEQIEAVKKIVGSMNLSQLETKTNEELTTLKKEMDTLRKEMKERELADRTKQELEALKVQLNQQLTASEGKTKQELKLMKKAVDSINVSKLESQTNEELIMVKKELTSLKEQLKQTEKSSKMKLELAMLKKSLEAELRNTQGKNKEEIVAIKSAIKTIDKNNTDKKSFDELSVIKAEVSKIKDEMLLKEESLLLKKDLEELRAKLKEQLAASDGRSKEEMMSVKSAVDIINIKTLEAKNREEFDAMKHELEQVKKQMYDREAANKLKIELALMKKALEAELARSQDKNRDDVVALQKSVDQLNEQNLNNQNTEQLAALKSEIDGLKKQMKEKDQAVKDLESMKTLLEEQLKQSEGKTKEELTVIKEAVEAIDVKKFETQNKEEWIQVKSEINSLKQNITETQSHVKTRKDLEILKEALEAEMKSSDGKTKEELAAMKMAVEAIDLRKLEKANHAEWDALKTEVDALKKELKIKECENLMAQLEDDLKNTKGLHRLELARFRRTIGEIDMDLIDLSYYDLVEKKREIEAVRDDLLPKKKGTVAPTLPPTSKAPMKTSKRGPMSDSGVEMRGGSIGSGSKKKGLRKIFGRLLGRKKNDLESGEKDIQSQPDPETLMMPPSMLGRQSAPGAAEDSEEDEETIVDGTEEKVIPRTEVEEEEKKEDDSPSYLPASVNHVPVKSDDNASVVSSSSKRSMRSASTAKSCASKKSARSQKSMKSQKSAHSQRSAAESTTKEKVEPPPKSMDPALAPLNAEVDLDALNLVRTQSATKITQTEEGGLEVSTVISDNQSVEIGLEEVETVFTTNDDGVTAVSF